MKNKIFIFPLSLAVILFASIIIIFSPLHSAKIIKVPTGTVDPVVITSPDLSQVITSPVTLVGKIDPSWVFEASFPIELFDNKEKSLYKGVGSVPNWTDSNSNLVDFTANIKFSTTATSGTLEIRNDNPSGLPENNKSFKIPVIFSKK